MFMQFIHKRIHQEKRLVSARGFSLVELLVSLSIFAIVMTISVGTLLIMVDINAKAQALYSSSTNLSFAVDNMARELRTGRGYYCYSTTSGSPLDPFPSVATNDCLTPQNSITFFRDADGKQIGYRKNGDKLEQKIAGEAGGAWIPITSNDVVIEKFELTVTGTDQTDRNQPTTSVFIKGYVNNGLDTDTDFEVQTRMTQHKIDL
jgi:prepilin-type N-terminal cleavage/methylation domain-containing protein